jgi:hypothetical protein
MTYTLGSCKGQVMELLQTTSKYYVAFVAFVA